MLEVRPNPADAHTVDFAHLAVYNLLRGAMPVFLLGPTGLVPIQDKTLTPCPECGVKQSVLVESHKLQCGTQHLKYPCHRCPKWHKNGTLCPTVLKPTDPPRAASLFDIPAPTFWVYRVEFRTLLIFTDGTEGWSEWTPLNRPGLKRYYLTERSAAKALARLQRQGRLCGYGRRENRVGRVERHDRRPAKR